eukprot:3479157-Rhodomonas_salina.1
MINALVQISVLLYQGVRFGTLKSASLLFLLLGNWRVVVRRSPLTQPAAMVSVSVFNISKASRRYMPFTEPQAIALETCDKRKMIVEADVLLPVRLAPETPHKLATAFQQSTAQDGFECVESFLSGSQSSFGSPASVS